MNANDCVKTYKFENATIYVHGEVNKERLKTATVKFFKDFTKSKLHKEVTR